ncbi:MAG: LamG-like jellyroll fold domain-containing protein [Candidatus Omnitrophota bacterium]|nr:LamG-like jellyroll fold domain-containing protein [Candidatus Omnitrophota bacterium]
MQAQVPRLIRYQGTVVDANNIPLEGSYTLTFRVYDVATGGAALWTETQTPVPVSRGVFSILLGQVTPLNLPFDKDSWLSTQVGTDTEMSPRQRLTSVPYAYRAVVADQTQDQPPGFEVDTSGTLTDGLIAYWKFEESGGARDDQKGPNDLADHNTVTQAAGKKGNAALFTAANNESLSIPDNAALSMGAEVDFTIAAWVYLADDVGQKVIVAKRDLISTPGIAYQIARSASVNVWRLNVGNNVASAVAEVSTSGDLSGAWHFVVGWHDAVANTINLQVDEGSVSSTSYSSGSYDDTNPFILGNATTGTDEGVGMGGRIDEVGIWKRVLTTQERTDLYNNGAGNTYSLGKAASPWTQADTGIAYTGGRIGIGTLSIPNILSVQQTSSTDPIADSWTVYPSDRQHKHIIQPAPAGYLAQLKATELYEWTRTPTSSDEEAKQELRKSQPTAEELQAKKRELTLAKAGLPKFTTKRVGMVIDDANVPAEVLTFNPDGTKAGIDLLAYLGYLHAALKETALKLDELESRLPKK